MLTDSFTDFLRKSTDSVSWGVVCLNVGFISMKNEQSAQNVFINTFTLFPINGQSTSKPCYLRSLKRIGTVFFSFKMPYFEKLLNRIKKTIEKIWPALDFIFHTLRSLDYTLFSKLWKNAEQKLVKIFVAKIMLSHCLSPHKWEQVWGRMDHFE